MVRRKLLIILIGVVLLGVVSQFEDLERLKKQVEVNERELDCVGLVLRQYVQPRDGSIKMLQRVTPSVIKIIIRIDDRYAVRGSGVCVGNGLVVTCAHLFRSEPNVSDIRINFSDKQSFIPTGYAISGDNDIAVVAFDPNGYEHPWVNIKCDAPVQVGQSVFSIGCPRGLDFSVSKGIVSKEEALVNGMTVIQVDSALNIGNSGGPTFDEWGNLLGIGSFIYFSIGTNGNIGLGFIIPTRIILKELPELTNRVERPMGK